MSDSCGSDSPSDSPALILYLGRPPLIWILTLLPSTPYSPAYLGVSLDQIHRVRYHFPTPPLSSLWSMTSRCSDLGVNPVIPACRDTWQRYFTPRFAQDNLFPVYLSGAGCQMTCLRLTEQNLSCLDVAYPEGIAYARAVIAVGSLGCRKVYSKSCMP